MALAPTAPNARARCRERSLRLKRANVKVTFVEEIKTAEDAAEQIPASGAYHAAQHVRNEAQTGKEEHQHPEFAGSHALIRAVRSFRKKRQDHQRHDGEANPGAQFEIVDLAHK